MATRATDDWRTEQLLSFERFKQKEGASMTLQRSVLLLLTLLMICSWLAPNRRVRADTVREACMNQCSLEKGQCESGVDEEYEICALWAEWNANDCLYQANLLRGECEGNCYCGGLQIDPDCILHRSEERRGGKGRISGGAWDHV